MAEMWQKLMTPTSALWTRFLRNISSIQSFRRVGHRHGRPGVFVKHGDRLFKWWLNLSTAPILFLDSARESYWVLAPRLVCVQFGDVWGNNELTKHEQTPPKVLHCCLLHFQTYNQNSLSDAPMVKLPTAGSWHSCSCHDSCGKTRQIISNWIPKICPDSPLHGQLGINCCIEDASVESSDYFQESCWIYFRVSGPTQTCIKTPKSGVCSCLSRFDHIWHQFVVYLMYMRNYEELILLLKNKKAGPAALHRAPEFISCTRAKSSLNPSWIPAGTAWNQQRIGEISCDFQM